MAQTQHTPDTADTADKIAMLLGGGLILLGTTLMGVAESFLTDHTVEPNGNLGDAIIHVTHDPTIRAYLIAAGLVVWFVWVLYRLANPRTGTTIQP